MFSALRTWRLASLSPHSRPAAGLDLGAEPRQLAAEFVELRDALGELAELRRRRRRARDLCQSATTLPICVVELEQSRRRRSSTVAMSGDM